MSTEYSYTITPTANGSYNVKSLGATIPNIAEVFNTMLVDYFKIPQENIPEVLEVSTFHTEMALCEIIIRFSHLCEFSEPVILNLVANAEGSITALGLRAVNPMDTYGLVNPYASDMTAFATQLGVVIYQKMKLAMMSCLWYKTGTCK